MKKILFSIFVSFLLLSCNSANVNTQNDTENKKIDNLKKDIIIQKDFSSWVIIPNIPDQPDL